MRVGVLLTIVGVSGTTLEYDQKRDGCTTLIFGKSVVLDRNGTRNVGPVVTHVSDCSDCDVRMAFVPSKRHGPGAKRPVYDGTHSLYPRFVSPDRANTYAPVSDIKVSEPVGFIDEVEMTHGLWESFYPLINEKGLAFGESTTEGKPVLANAMLGHPDPRDPSRNGTALYTISPLMAIAMERCGTARCAIKVIGDLAQEGGFTGEEYATAEAVTIADADGEAWVFEIVGDGNRDKPGALWVAARIPDDHVSVVANNMIIQEVDLDDHENFMFSSNLVSRTKELGIYKGDGSSKFFWAESTGNQIPLPQYSAMRTWRIYSQLAPSTVKDYIPNPKAYPFSIKVEVPVTIEDVMNLHRDHYQGTEFDLSQGVMAGVWGSPNLEMGSTPGIVGGYPRAISIMRSSYTTIGVPKDHHPKIYFAVDQPMTSVFVPFYAEALANGTYHESFGNPHGPSQQVFDRTTAWWAFDFVANWMCLNYRNMSQEEVYPARDELQRWVFDQVDEIEANADSQPSKVSEILALGQAHVQGHVTDVWWKLADMLIARYNDGFLNFGRFHPDKVVGIQYPLEWLRMVGYSMDFYTPSRHWLAPAGSEAREIANSRSLVPGEGIHQSDNGASRLGSIAFTAVIAFIAGRWFSTWQRKKAAAPLHDQSVGYTRL
jgi:dipeptidase